jgi:hypothetical protein
VDVPRLKAADETDEVCERVIASGRRRSPIVNQRAGHPGSDGSSVSTGWPYPGLASLRHLYPCSGPANAVLVGCPQSGQSGGVTLTDATPDG